MANRAAPQASFLILVTVAFLSFGDNNGVEVNVVVCSSVRVTQNVEFKPMLSLRKRELQLDEETFHHCDALDDQQLSPICYYLERIE